MDEPAARPPCARPPAPGDEGDVFESPLGGAKVGRVLRLLELSPASDLLDLCCGGGEVWRRGGRRGRQCRGGPPRRGQGVPAGARGEAVVRGSRRGHVYPETAARRRVLRGSLPRLRGHRATLKVLRNLVRPGGHVVVGDIYWTREPAAEYLAVLGETRADHLDHAGNVAAAVDEGLLPLYAAASSEDEWDDFEGRSWYRKLREAEGRPDYDERARAVLRW